MPLIINNIQYHRGKETFEISEDQALLLIADMIIAALAQNSFTAEITQKDDDNQNN